MSLHTPPIPLHGTPHACSGTFTQLTSNPYESTGRGRGRGRGRCTGGAPLAFRGPARVQRQPQTVQFIAKKSQSTASSWLSHVPPHNSGRGMSATSFRNSVSSSKNWCQSQPHARQQHRWQWPRDSNPVSWPAAPRKAKATSGTPAVAKAQTGIGAGTETEKETGAGCSVVYHELPSSLRLEVLVHKAAAASCAPQGGASNPPLVFIHGSYHAAWCWREHWMPFFSRQGYDCYAISLLGQSHAMDVSDVIRGLVGAPPVLIGHSFGGLIVQAYLSLRADPKVAENAGGGALQPLRGAALLCSVPPSGNKDLVMRYLLTKPVLSIKVTLAFAAKMFATNTGLCRDSFFSPGMSDQEVQRYQALMAQSSRMPLFDLRKLNSSLPVPRPPLETVPPMLVLGAEHDAVLDVQALQETADFFGSSYVVVPHIAHDVMLDLKWESAAQDVLSWLHSSHL